MIGFLRRLLFDNWQRKIIALISAFIIWFLINNSITITKTIPNVPIRIINLPANKTIAGLLPSGVLDERINVTVSGSKTIVEELNSNDIEIVIDADNKGDQWIAKVDKRSLVSLNPEIDLSHNISEVLQNEFVIHLSPLIKEKVPVVAKVIGEPPHGYQFLDVWPQFLTQTVSGPEDDVRELQEKGLELIIDLSLISSTDLLEEKEKADEVSFPIPTSWKKVAIPFQKNIMQELNDPEAHYLRVDFLKRTFLSLETPIPISLFFPLSSSETINPDTFSLDQSPIIEKLHGIQILKMPLFAKNVSKRFLDAVRNNLEIVITVGYTPTWSLEFINPRSLENVYVSEALFDKDLNDLQAELKEGYLRNRFHTYMRDLKLFTDEERKLKLNIEFVDSKIVVNDAS